MKARPERIAICARGGLIAVLVVGGMGGAACTSSRDAELRFETAEAYELAHADSIMNASEINANAASNLSAIPLSFAEVAVIELDDLPVGQTTTTSAEIGASEVEITPALGAPKSASEAAERGTTTTPRTTPPSSTVTPEAVSPTAPAETALPR